MRPRQRSTEAVSRVAYTVEEVILALPISRSKLFELIGSGQLKTFTVGSRRLIPVDALREFVERSAA